MGRDVLVVNTDRISKRCYCNNALEQNVSVTQPLPWTLCGFELPLEFLLVFNENSGATNISSNNVNGDRQLVIGSGGQAIR